MDSRSPVDEGRHTHGCGQEAEEFVRFCHARRRVGWPELYDEMWAVASRRLYKGLGFEELSEKGISFSLFGCSDLAALVNRIAATEASKPQPKRASTRGRRARATETAEAAVAAPAPAAPAPEPVVREIAIPVVHTVPVAIPVAPAVEAARITASVIEQLTRSIEQEPVGHDALRAPSVGLEAALG